MARRATSGLSGGTRGSGNGDEIMVMLVHCAIDPIALREEGVEPLYESRVAIEEIRHAVNDTGSIDSRENEHKKYRYGGIRTLGS